MCAVFQRAGFRAGAARKRPAMILAAAASTALGQLLAGPPRPARCLGASRAGLYLQVAAPPGVMAILAHDAVRLPCALVLASTAAELPLTSLQPPGPDSAHGLAGGGAVTWTGPDGPVTIRAVRSWPPPRGWPGLAETESVRAVRAALPSPATAGLGRWRPGRLSPAAVPGLLGRGPGLTPSGDDLLSGYLIGAAAFGLDAEDVRRAVARYAGERTTALSAALLGHAARGECIPEAAALTAAMTGRGQPGPAVRALVRVGHTSGAALGWGVLTAAEQSLRAWSAPSGRQLARPAPAEPVRCVPAELAVGVSAR
jgi:hypothetical protein